MCFTCLGNFNEDGWDGELGIGGRGRGRGRARGHRFRGRGRGYGGQAVGYYDYGEYDALPPQRGKALSIKFSLQATSDKLLCLFCCFILDRSL